MYPFNAGPTYALNQWYVLGWSREFDEKPVRRLVMDQPILMFRASDGLPVAMTDRCAHRHYPLSRGKRRGEVSCRNDAGTLRGRRILEKMIVKSGVNGAGRAQNK